MAYAWNFFDLVRECGLEILDIAQAPVSPGFYLLFAEQGEFIYVGKAENLRERLSTHFGDSEENERIRALARYAIWQQTNTVAAAETAEGGLYDHWVMDTGVPPIANKDKPPESKLSDQQVLAAKLRALFGEYGTLSRRLQ